VAICLSVDSLKLPDAACKGTALPVELGRFLIRLRSDKAIVEKFAPIEMKNLNPTDF
jgi:hypothetical protein